MDLIRLFFVLASLALSIAFFRQFVKQKSVKSLFYSILMLIFAGLTIYPFSIYLTVLLILWIILIIVYSLKFNQIK